ncbi:MAG: ribonuclease HII [Candidatus Omnitrophica bacterium]|nr:ribonuclease HII [Candidatus Omnitrophota bacterium]
MPRSLYDFERRFWGQGLKDVAGVDEAGRGPLAGPVVAAAVILDPEARIRGLNDSKQLEPARRESLFARIVTTCRVGVGLVSERRIDEINIYQASREAMRQAISRLPCAPEALLVDGPMRLEFQGPKMEIVHGDALSASIAAASIVAKVIRDQIMLAYHELEPAFSFHQHKGYPTPEHLELLEKHGPSSYHRQSFRPIRKDGQELVIDAG